VRAGVRLLRRASVSLLTLAEQGVASELNIATIEARDDDFESQVRDELFDLALDIVRPCDSTELGLAMALAACCHLKKPVTTLAEVIAAGRIIPVFEIAFLGAQARGIWVPRSPLGGLDLWAAIG
jgi:hypothetical protein